MPPRRRRSRSKSPRRRSKSRKSRSRSRSRSKSRKTAGGGGGAMRAVWTGLGFGVGTISSLVVLLATLLGVPAVVIYKNVDLGRTQELLHDTHFVSSTVFPYLRGEKVTDDQLKMVLASLVLKDGWVLNKLANLADASPKKDGKPLNLIQERKKLLEQWKDMKDEEKAYQVREAARRLKSSIEKKAAQEDIIEG